jgi:hypothetical protein
MSFLKKPSYQRMNMAPQARPLQPPPAFDVYCTEGSAVTTRRSRSRHVGVSVWCPKNLDVDVLLRSHDKRVREGVLWLGHCIFTRLADDHRCRDRGQVPLRAEYLRKIIGRHHLDDVRDAAWQVRYIDHSRSYSTGVRSMPYWILPPYDQAEVIQRRVTDPTLCMNIRRWHESRQHEEWQRIREEKTAVRATVCNHLWQNLQRVEIDEVVDLDDRRQPAHRISVEKIRSGDWWFKVDGYGRIHTNLTNLAKTLRKHIAVEGKRLVNVDISESQPLMFGIALAQAETERSRKAKANDEKGEKENKRRQAYHMMDDTMMDKNTLLGEGFDRAGLSDDLRHWVELCETRRLYETVAAQLGTTREEAKRRVMIVLFDKPWHHNAASEALEKLFPMVVAAAREIKARDHRRLAHFAQRIESAFMFGRVVPRIMDERPDLFIATIHDSILTPTAEAVYVRQVMLEEFSRLGVSPHVKVEEQQTTR